jgi:hypothetical protein
MYPMQKYHFKTLHIARLEIHVQIKARVVSDRINQLQHLALRYG